MGPELAVPGRMTFRVTQWSLGVWPRPFWWTVSVLSRPQSALFVRAAGSQNRQGVSMGWGRPDAVRG